MPSFSSIARWIANQLGHAYAFCTATALCLVWLISGPFFGFSDTWQLLINTSTTVLTFLMVFLLQHTQNRDTLAIHLKLDELIRTSKASNRMAEIEELSEQELRLIQEHRSTRL